MLAEGSYISQYIAPAEMIEELLRRDQALDEIRQSLWSGFNVQNAIEIRPFWIDILADDVVGPVTSPSNRKLFLPRRRANVRML